MRDKRDKNLPFFYESVNTVVDLGCRAQSKRMRGEEMKFSRHLYEIMFGGGHGVVCYGGGKKKKWKRGTQTAFEPRRPVWRKTKGSGSLTNTAFGQEKWLL